VEGNNTLQLAIGNAQYNVLMITIHLAILQRTNSL